jgi:hypothetical protein
MRCVNAVRPELLMTQAVSTTDVQSDMFKRAVASQRHQALPEAQLFTTQCHDHSCDALVDDFANDWNMTDGT